MAPSPGTIRIKEFAFSMTNKTKPQLVISRETMENNLANLVTFWQVLKYF